MKPSFCPRSLALTLVLSSAALVLSGCGGMNVAFPDSVAAVQVQGPPIVGNAYGGHAPIVGSHVYLLQPGTSGIGSQATSILGTGTSTSPGGFPLHTNPAPSSGPPVVVSDPNIPAGWQYVITDSIGGFNLTNAYVCTAGQPVYIYLTGGNPGTVANPAIVLLTILGNCPSNGALNFGSSSNAPINFVYMNEVSTIAAAYVFQPFTSAANNTAVNIGSTGTTQGLVGIENAANTAAQLYAIQGNAQISKSNDGEGHIANFQTQSITFGSGGVIVTPNQGNGVVPQATIDTLANILAACADGASGAASTTCTTLFSNATDNGFLGGTRPTDTATAAINIARYPAGNHSTTTPGLVNTNFVTNLFAIPSGIIPFTPNLAAAPNDFTIVINYPTNSIYPGSTASNPTLGRAESIAVDNLGQLWITAQTNKDVVRWSPLGVQNSENISPTGDIYGYVSIDGSNNAWTGSANATTGIQEAGSNGVFTTTYGDAYTAAYTIVTDMTGNAYFFASNNGVADGATYNTSGNYQMWKYNAGGSLLSNNASCNGKTGPFVFYCTSGFVISAGNNVAHGAIESAAKGGHLWVTSESSPNYQIARITPTGGKDFSFTTSVQQPEFPSLDRNGNAWIANQAATGTIYKVTSTGTSPFYNYTTLTSASTGATLTWTFGSAVDGNNNVWFANRCGNYGNCGGGTGINSIIQINGANNLAISPPTNYIPEAQYGTATTFTKMLNDSLNVAIDPSGNVWVTNYIGNSVAEMVGAAAPVVTPLSLAAGNNMIGVAP
jgi:hypothetical protein